MGPSPFSPLTSQVLSSWTVRKLLPWFPKGFWGHLFLGSPIFLQLGCFLPRTLHPNPVELEKGAIELPDLLHQSSKTLPLQPFFTQLVSLSPNIQIKDYRNISRHVDRKRVLFSPRDFFHHVLLVFFHSVLSFNKPNPQNGHTKFFSTNVNLPFFSWRNFRPHSLQQSMFHWIICGIITFLNDCVWEMDSKGPCLMYDLELGDLGQVPPLCQTRFLLFQGGDWARWSSRALEPPWNPAVLILCLKRRHLEENANKKHFVFNYKKKHSYKMKYAKPELLMFLLPLSPPPQRVFWG